MTEEYIRGKRQGQALFFFIEGILRRNLRYAKRELEILFGFAKPELLFGFAKPYKLYFAPTIKSSYVALFGEEAYEKLKQKTGAIELEDVENEKIC